MKLPRPENPKSREPVGCMVFLTAIPVISTIIYVTNQII